MMNKSGAVGGQDLRSFRSISTSFPTDDSKRWAMNKLRDAQSKAEVGPVPSQASLKPPGRKLREVAVKMRTTKGMLPKIGSAGGTEMSYDQRIQSDPLVQFMRKQAEAAACLVSDQADSSGDYHKNLLKSLFESRAFRRKWTEKDVQELPNMKTAASKEGPDWKTLALIPPALAAGGAGIGGLAGAASAMRSAQPVLKGLGHGTGYGALIGGGVGLAASALIGIGHLLTQADPSGKTLETALRLAPAAMAMGGAMVDIGGHKKEKEKTSSIHRIIRG